MLIRVSATTMLLSSVVLATPALGQVVPATSFNAAVSFSCVAEQSTDSKEKLVTIKGNNREIIALCNNLDPYDSDNSSAISDLTKNQAVVLDGNYTLRVIDRCTEQTICQADLEGESQCSVAVNESQNSSTADRICTIFPGALMRTGDGTILFFDGSLRCKDVFTEKTKGESTQFGFQTGCVGQPSIGFNMFEETVPCTMNVSTSSEFQVPKNCPAE